MSGGQLFFDASRLEDREAFAGIVRRYQNLVTALTFSMTGNLQQSEDLAQETFVAAWQRLSNEESQLDVAAEKLGPWLCGIARNLTHNWLRRTSRERKTQHIPAEDGAISGSLIASESPDTEFSRETQAAMVWETLRHIPEHYREPLVMFYRNGASVREIAESLELTESCVKQRISRGRAMLKQEVASRFESFLAHLRPGEHFLAAVMAAIPILVTGKQAVAASSVGIVAAQTATSTGSGHPIFAGITTAFWSFVCSVGPFLTVFLGTILGVWSGVRHAPTRRARVLMLKTVLEWLALLCLPTVLCVFLYCGWKISRDDAAFQKTPPRLPNLLPILTGEEKWPKGFRNRINFWGDLTGIGFGMVCMQVFSIGWYFRFRMLPEMPWLGFPTGGASMILIDLSVLAYLAFAIFFAGIPRRRYWGMILLAGTIFVCDASMICYTKLWQHVHPSEFAMVFGLNAWFLLCFALSGVAGLWVFRKKTIVLGTRSVSEYPRPDISG